MMTEYQMKSDTQDEAPVSLTAVAVCKRLLAEPTEAISQILLHVELSKGVMTLQQFIESDKN